MDSMKKRLLTAAIGVPLAVAVFVLSEYFHWVTYLLISVLSVFMVFELLSAKKLHKNLKIFIPCALYAFLQPILIVTRLALLPAYIFAALVFFVMIVFNEEITYGDASFGLLGTLVIVWGLTSMLIVPCALRGYYSFYFVMGIGIPWCADAGAYFAGVFLGRHKLCPKVSPKKTVEGFLGGLLAGTLSAVIIGFVYSFIYQNSSFNYLLLLLCGVCCSLVSVLGDLSFSLIKRSCGIKDYGSIFPGHGGFLDRFDSVIFSAPIIYFVSAFAPIFTINFFQVT